MNNAKYDIAKFSVIMYVAGCQQMAEIVNSRYFDGCADIHWIGDRYDLCDFSGEWWLTPRRNAPDVRVRPQSGGFLRVVGLQFVPCLYSDKP